MDLAIGDDVSPGMRIRDRDGTCGTLVSEERPFTGIWIVSWDDDTPRASYRTAQLSSFEHVCRDCGLAQDEHAKGGKCLYGPGVWEA